MVLYATDLGAPSGKAIIKVLQGGNSYALRRVTAGGPYLLGLAQYNGAWFVAAGAATEDKVYVYKDPVGDLQNNPALGLVPVTILKTTQPNYLAFSANFRFVMAESGASFAVYDAQNDKAYSYELKVPLDAGAHAVWLDGSHLTLVSNGTTIVFDYDDANQQALSPAAAGTVPFLDPKLHYLYAEAPAPAGPGLTLTTTALTVPAAP